MAILTVKTVVASAGLIKIEQATDTSFKLMRHGSVDSYLGHLTEQELRDLHEVSGDLIAFIDHAAEQPLEQAS